MSNKSKSDDQFSQREARRRFEAALRGARAAGHKPMAEISPAKKREPGKPGSRPVKARPSKSRRAQRDKPQR
jgi:hypothetical protein